MTRNLMIWFLPLLGPSVAFAGCDAAPELRQRIETQLTEAQANLDRGYRIRSPSEAGCTTTPQRVPVIRRWIPRPKAAAATIWRQDWLRSQIVAAIER